MKKLLFLISALLPFTAISEDIEVYLGSTAANKNNRPKVLMVFDNSGSMGSYVKIKTPYNKNTSYPAVNGNPKLSGDYVYYVKGDASIKPVPDAPNEKRRFLMDINSCSTAKTKLETVGYYIGYVREYTFVGESGSWKELPELDGTNIKMVDCWDDIRLSDPNNAKYHKAGLLVPHLPGYPVDGKGNTTTPQYYTPTAAASNTKLGAGEVVTLYSDNYLRWAHNNNLGTINEQKMVIAKEAVTALIDAAPTVDFALEVFNYNTKSSNSGGRIPFGFKDMTVTNTNNLKNMINNLVPRTNTPLCESLYEAYRYFSGQSVHFGDRDASATPKEDFTVQTAGVYDSPFNSCSDDIYVIMITDGKPTHDYNADNKIIALPGNNVGASSHFGNYLSSLTHWMKNNDLDQDDSNGFQTSTFYSIGFDLGDATAVKLLKEASANGGGKYYDASDPSSLLSSLQSALVEILQQDSSFTAPSVASNNFDRTETLDSVYYAMFTPDRGPRWQGNLKKLKVTSKGLVDRTNASAVDSNGNIANTAKTFWSTGAADGSTVADGGVAQMFSNMLPSARNIYSDLGSSSALKLLTKTNATSASAFKTEDALANAMGIDKSEISNYLDWAKGKDLDDEDKDLSTTDMRPDVFGDPLHSKPLVINYGGTKGLRLVVGTNAGAFHMFKDSGDTVSESWAFMPKEFFKNIRALRDNFTSSDKLYGIDGTTVGYLIDYNGDGEISGANEKAWIFFGLRRGGSSYYALDVTDPDSPQLMWHHDSSEADFSEIKQSWSTPRIGFSKLNIVGGVPKPVLIFGAGYDTNKDSTAIGTSDTKGRGVYMLDAESGKLLWSMTPSTTPAFPGTDSVPSAVATLDGDSDGFVDRLYVGDTGGNVWRIDMPGTNTSDWQASKLASLGHSSDLAQDRRFFAEPAIARAIITETFEHTEAVGGVPKTAIYKVEKPFDAILIGSGDRTNPLDTSTDDYLFMIKDENILTQTFATAPTPSLFDDLYDYTSDPFGTLEAAKSSMTEEEYQDAYNELSVKVSEKDGWRLKLEQVSGEKSFARPEAVAGVAYFTTYGPPVTSSSTCSIDVSGSSYLYALDLSLGVKIKGYSSRIMETPGTVLTDSLTLITLPTDPSAPTPTDPSNKPSSNPIAILAGEAMQLCDANGNCSGLSRATLRNNLYITER